MNIQRYLIYALTNFLLFLTISYFNLQEIFEQLLKDNDNNIFNNSCVAEHLVKAFASINYLSDSTSIELSIKDQQQKQNVSRTKNNLYQRIVRRKIESNKFINRQSPSTFINKYSPDLTNSPTESGDLQDLLNADAMTITSSLSEYDNLQFDTFNLPKNLFNLLMICQKANAIEPWKSLLVACVSLKNPVAALISASISTCDTADSENEQHLFECCCCWLFASFKLEDKQLQEIKLSNAPLYVSWSFKDFELLLSYGLRTKDNLMHFYHALQLFIDCNRNPNHQHNPLIELVKFLIEFLIEKNYHESLAKLMGFMDKLREYQRIEDPINNPLYNRSDIGKLCFILIDCSLRQTNCVLELHILLKHFEMSGIQRVFDEEIVNSKPNLAMLFKLIECIHQTDCNLIDMNKLLDLNIRSIDFLNYMKEIVEHLQKRKFFKEAKEFAKICELDVESIILNEFLIKSESQSENFDFWVDCLRSFINNRISFKAKETFLCERINSIESRSLKCYLLFNLISDNKQLLFEEDNQNLIDLHLEFWNYLIDLEHDYQFLSSENILSYSSIKNQTKLNQGEFKAIDYIWSLLVKYGLKFEAKLDNRFTYKLTEDECLLDDDKEITLHKLLDNLLNNNCIQLTYIIANLFKFKSINLEIIQYANELVHKSQVGSLDLNLSSNFSKIIDRSKELYNIKIKRLEKDSDDCELNLHILESLYEQMTFGRKSLQNIILMYKISNQSCMRYYSSNDDEINFKLLIRLIERANRSSEHFQLAKELTQLKNITDKRIVNYVCDNLDDYLLDDQDNEFNQQSYQQINPQQDDYVPTRKQQVMSKILVIIRLLNDPGKTTRFSV